MRCAAWFRRVTLTLLADSQQSPELRRKLEESGSVIAPPHLDMARFLASETAKYQRIVDFAKIRE